VRAQWVLAGAGLALAVLLAAGCGTGGPAHGGDPSAGKALFVKTCGSCHTLADAGTKGTIGPNLDDAFATDRAQGFDESTMRDVVLGQIREPITDPPTGVPGMPAHLLKGQDAQDVAAYVASVAGVGAQVPTPPAAAPPPPATPPPAAPPPPASPPPSAAPPPPSPPPAGAGNPAQGKALFAAQGCAACHTYTPAGASAKIGPDLDHVAADAQKANQGTVEQYVHTSIVDPNAYVVPGFPKGVMPSFASLSDAQVADLVAFLTQK
jgi:mono/diheme cytochrome c family protein